MYAHSDLPDSTSPLNKAVAPPSSEIQILEQEIERLLLITEALWTLLKEKHGLEDQDLFRKIIEIDLRDGKLDGRVAPAPPQPCPKCNRTVSKKSIRCMYCGEPQIRDPFAR